MLDSIYSEGYLNICYHQHTLQRQHYNWLHVNLVISNNLTVIFFLPQTECLAQSEALNIGLYIKLSVSQENQSQTKDSLQHTF